MSQAIDKRTYEDDEHERSVGASSEASSELSSVPPSIAETEVLIGTGELLGHMVPPLEFTPPAQDPKAENSVFD